MANQNVTEQELKRALALSIGRKSVVIALVLWFFLGFFGVHRMYLDKVGSGIVMAILTIIGGATTFILIGFLFLAIVGIWWLIDLIIIIRDANAHNRLHDSLTKNLDDR